MTSVFLKNPDKMFELQYDLDKFISSYKSNCVEILSTIRPLEHLLGDLKSAFNDTAINEYEISRIFDEILDCVEPIMMIPKLYILKKSPCVYSGKDIYEKIKYLESVKEYYKVSKDLKKIEDKLKDVNRIINNLENNREIKNPIKEKNKEQLQKAINHMNKLSMESKDVLNDFKRLLTDYRIVDNI